MLQRGQDRNKCKIKSLIQEVEGALNRSDFSGTVGEGAGLWEVWEILPFALDSVCGRRVRQYSQILLSGLRGRRKIIPCLFPETQHDSPIPPDVGICLLASFIQGGCNPSSVSSIK